MTAILNPQYMPAPSLQEGFIDKLTGLPLSFGMVFTYKDESRTVLKPIFTISNPSGSPLTYNYIQLPNPVVLSGIGTFQDANGNDIIPYFFPFDSNGNIELYYIIVQDQFGVTQFTRQGFPNITAGSNGSNNFSNNFIPNGQLLIHNASYPNTPTTANFNYGIYTTKVQLVAPSGFTWETSSTSTATDQISFTRLTQYTNNPTTAPRYLVQVNRTAPSSSADAVADFRIKFMDVNKFGSLAGAPTEALNFQFTAQAIGADISNVSIALIRYYGSGAGASTTTDIPVVSSFNILLNQFTTFSFKIPFDTLVAANTVGPNDDDFVQIAIRFPIGVSTTFTVQMTDFILTALQTPISFPSTTNGEFMLGALSNLAPTSTADSTANIGSTTTNNYYQQDGSNLFLPVIMTPNGFDYDYSSIGTIISKTTTTAANNELLCDGTAYVTKNYSALGIPYSRLFNVLLSNSGIPTVPMWGTGPLFNTAYDFAGAGNIFRLANNFAGAGTIASDGDTGWTFSTGTAGFASINLFAVPWTTATMLVLGTNFLAPHAPASAGTSGFTVTVQTDNTIFTGITAGFQYSVTIECTAAAPLQNTGGPGKYFQISNSVADFYVWFFFTNETDPAPGGTGIKVFIPSSTLTAENVAEYVQEALNGYQVSIIIVLTTPTAGQFFKFTATSNYYVWYKVNGSGTDPAPGGTGIEVDILSGDTTTMVANKTVLAINSYQFAVPDLRGQFLRGLDPNATFDLDAPNRFSRTISGYFGAHIGTFENQQFVNHQHYVPTCNAVTNLSNSPLSSPGTTNAPSGLLPTGLAGGHETRPYNVVVNFYIKY